MGVVGHFNWNPDGRCQRFGALVRQTSILKKWVCKVSRFESIFSPHIADSWNHPLSFATNDSGAVDRVRGALPALFSSAYPFAVGPLYLLGAELARRTFSSALVRALLARGSGLGGFRFRRGEDASVGYLVHLAGATEPFSYGLLHLTATALHDEPGDAKLGVPGVWALPTASLVVHRLKWCSVEGVSPWGKLLNLTRHATPRAALCPPPFRFRWVPRKLTAAFAADPRRPDPAASWEQYVRRPSARDAPGQNMYGLHRALVTLPSSLGRYAASWGCRLTAVSSAFGG